MRAPRPAQLMVRNVHPDGAPQNGPSGINQDPADSPGRVTRTMSDNALSLELRQQSDFRFEVDFKVPGAPLLVTDEPPPLGGGAGPNPARLLGAAVANCLAASLLFSLRKFRNDTEPLRAQATVAMQRNAQGRLRIGRIAVDIHLSATAAAIRSLDRILAQFEDFCVVTQSVRAGITVDVRVIDARGTVLPLPAAAQPPAEDRHGVAQPA